MVGRGKTIIVLVGGLVLGATVRVDMVPLACVDAVSFQPSHACLPANLQATDSCSQSMACAGVTDLGPSPRGLLPRPTAEGHRTGAMPPAPIVADGQNSLSLCLYALLGLGLCRSAPFVKKLYLVSVLDWYHSGGPCQIGHSFAIVPGCLSRAPIYCFIPPDSTAQTQDLLAQYRWGTVVSLWRQSQFTPVVLTSCGPP